MYMVTAGGPIVSRAMAVPVKVLNLICQDKTLLIQHYGLSLTVPNICANGPAV